MIFRLFSKNTAPAAPAPAPAAPANTGLSPAAPAPPPAADDTATGTDTDILPDDSASAPGGTATPADDSARTGSPDAAEENTDTSPESPEATLESQDTPVDSAPPADAVIAGDNGTDAVTGDAVPVAPDSPVPDAPAAVTDAAAADTAPLSNQSDHPSSAPHLPDMNTTAAPPAADTAVQSEIDPTDFAQAPVNQGLTPERKIELLNLMIRIRRFEEESGRQYISKGRIGGFLHRYDGQESIAVGCASLMGEHDHMITAYRDHGHALAVGMTMDECMAELLGKATGCSKGKGGSMHFFAPDKNYWGGHGIVGGQTPLGAGIAYYLKFKGLKGSCMTFMGDGAINQGAYHEALNLAGLFNLPVIFIIENNGYSMGTSQCRSSAFKNSLAYRADGYDIVWDIIHGWDLYEMRAKMQIAIDRAHNESRPTVIEVMTYRHYGHSVADANAKKYRTEEEIERYKAQNDPIRLWKDRLIQENVLTEEQYKEIDKAAKAEAAASADFAENSPFPEAEDITKDVYYEVDEFTEAGRTGKHFFND